MKRMRKNGWKLVLDMILLIVLALMYNKRVLGMEFHEIGGLALCGLFIVHKLLNFKWIVNVTKGLFSRRTPVRQKLYWGLDLLLLGSFAYVLVSGILISKVVFPSTSGGNAFKMGHYAAAALALALSGVHLGLHMGWIGQRMAFLKQWPLLLRRGLAVVLSVAVLAFGGLQITSTSFLQWLGNIGVVFGATTGAPGGMEQPVAGQTKAEVTSASSDLASEAAAPSETAANTAADAQAAALSETAANTAADVQAAALSETAANTAADVQAATVSASVSGGGFGPGNGGGLRDGQGPHGGGEGGAASGDVAGVVLSFAGILMAFAVVVAWLDALLKNRGRSRRLRRTVKEPV